MSEYLKDYMKEKNIAINCEICGGKYLAVTGKGRHVRTLKHMNATKEKEKDKIEEKMMDLKLASTLLEVKEFIDKKIKEVLEIKANS